MKVYEVKGDFQLAWVNCSEKVITGLLEHVVNDGAEIDRSKPVALELSDWEAPGDSILTDCVHIGAYGPLLLSERAISALGPLLSDAGYFLPTELAADTCYKLFICEREIDALDQERSDLTRFEDGMVWKVLRYELKPDLLRDMHVVRLKHRRSRVFVSDHFVQQVDRHHLTGFVFREVWSSDTGGVQLPPEMPPIERVPGEFAKRAKAKRAALRKALRERALVPGP